MKSIEARLDRLEAVHRRPSSVLSAAEQAELEAGMHRLLGLVPRDTEPEVIFRQMLHRIESGVATDRKLERVGGGNVELLRILVSIDDQMSVVRSKTLNLLAQGNVGSS